MPLGSQLAVKLCLYSLIRTWPNSFISVYYLPRVGSFFSEIVQLPSVEEQDSIVQAASSLFSASASV